MMVMTSNMTADWEEQARTKNGIGRRYSRQDAAMYGEGLCPHDKDEERDSRLRKKVEDAIPLRVN